MEYEECFSLFVSEDNFDLDSDDFDLLEDTSFDQLELELANTDNLALEVSSEISGLEKNKEMENLNALDLSLIHISEPTRPY